jgi:hypothetical protein
MRCPANWTRHRGQGGPPSGRSDLVVDAQVRLRPYDLWASSASTPISSALCGHFVGLANQSRLASPILLAALDRSSHVAAVHRAGRRDRLRATWLADCARLLEMATFLHAAGITCSQRLCDIIATLEPGDEATAVALLGGQR